LSGERFKCRNSIDNVTSSNSDKRRNVSRSVLDSRHSVPLLELTNSVSFRAESRNLTRFAENVLLDSSALANPDSNREIVLIKISLQTQNNLRTLFSFQFPFQRSQKLLNRFRSLLRIPHHDYTISL